MKVQRREFNVAHNVQHVQKTQRFNAVSIPKLNMSLKKDTLNFGAKFPLSTDKTKELAHTLTTSTSGVRKIGADYEAIVEPLTLGAMSWMKEQGIKDVTLAHDAGRNLTSNAGKKVAKMLVDHGFNVHTKTDGIMNAGNKIAGIKPTSTPEAALATKTIKEQTGNKTFGILLTPSHNPWEYGGFNFLTSHGEVASEGITEQIGKHMVKLAESNKDVSPLIKVSSKLGQVKPMDTFKMYNDNINKNVGIDWKAIEDAKVDIFYDDLGGTGGTITPKLFETNGVKLKKIMSTGGLEGPNPVPKNMTNLINEVKSSENKLALGLANDGDVDRVGSVIAKNEDGKAEVISFNDVGVALAHHQFVNRGHASTKNAALIMNHATSPEIAAVAEKHGAKVIETPVGFKYIGSEIQAVEKEGGTPILSIEESGGGTVAGNIPEKDGPVLLAMLSELVAKEKKPLPTILKEVKAGLPVRFDSGLNKYGFEKPEGMGLTVSGLDRHLVGEETQLAGLKVDLAKSQAHHAYIKKMRPSGDGTKLFFTDGSNVVLRNSGTEPITKIAINAAGKTALESAEKYAGLSKALGEIAESNGGVKK